MDFFGISPYLGKTKLIYKLILIHFRTFRENNTHHIITISFKGMVCMGGLRPQGAVGPHP
jgi:hypothetical protein